MGRSSITKAVITLFETEQDKSPVLRAACTDALSHTVSLDATVRVVVELIILIWLLRFLTVVCEPVKVNRGGDRLCVMPIVAGTETCIPELPE